MTEWPIVTVEAELAGPAGFGGGVADSAGVTRPPTASVRARQVPAGEGRTVVDISGGQHLRVPVADAEKIADGELVALGNVCVRVLDRRAADKDAAGIPIAKVPGRDLAEFVLLRIGPARLKPEEAAA